MEANVAEPNGISSFRIPILSDATNLDHYLVEVTVSELLLDIPSTATETSENEVISSIEKQPGGALKVQVPNHLLIV